MEKKEYIANCPNCARHIIVSSTRTIKNSTMKKPQRITKCSNCKQTVRATIVGVILQFADKRHNRLRIHFWSLA